MRESDVIEAAALALEQQGYAVRRAPLFEGVRPDLVAHRANDTLMVEIKRAGSGMSTARIEHYNAIASERGWRFALWVFDETGAVWAERGTPAEVPAVIATDETRGWTPPSDAMREVAMSLLILAASLESALRAELASVRQRAALKQRRADRLWDLSEEASEPRGDDWSWGVVLAELAVNGVVLQPEYRLFRDFLRARDAWVHGIASEPFVQHERRRRMLRQRLLEVELRARRIADLDE